MTKIKTFLAALAAGWAALPALLRITLEAMMLAAAASGLDTGLQYVGAITPETVWMVLVVNMLKAALPIARLAVGVAQKAQPAITR